MLVIPGLSAALVLGTVATPNLKVTISPSLPTIQHSLEKHYNLPDGTRLAVGDPTNPTVLAYQHRRLSYTPPKGQNIGTTMLRGFGIMRNIALDTVNGTNVASNADDKAAAKSR